MRFHVDLEFVVHTIEQLLGGHSFFSIDSGRSGSDAQPNQPALGFADFAVLFRTGDQASTLIDAFDRSGLPYKKHGDAAALIGEANEADFWDPRADRVSLLTLHAAKGLEFPIVFIVGLEDGVLPLSFGELDDAALAEERRLLYVGMTRAKDRLFLSRAVQRMFRGRAQSVNASRFLHDIESELTRHQRTPLTRRRPEDLQLRLL
jgi:DNA helicase-2/ATP-dependent DNA helicase PcrA